MHTHTHTYTHPHTHTHTDITEKDWNQPKYLTIRLGTSVAMVRNFSCRIRENKILALLLNICVTLGKLFNL